MLARLARPARWPALCRLGRPNRNCEAAVFFPACAQLLRRFGFVAAIIVSLGSKLLHYRTKTMFRTAFIMVYATGCTVS